MADHSNVCPARLTATLLRLAGEDRLPADTEAIDRDLAEDIVARDIPLSDITQALRSMQREWLSLLIDAAVGVRPDGISVIPALATSVTGTMDALFLHRNTLINRLERIQAVLGHGVAERSAETQAALVLAELFTRRPDDPAYRAR